MRLFEELKRRNVIRVGIAYVVIAWLLAQVAELGLDAFNAPDWVMQTILLVLALGLPLALFFAWAFELTPEGLKKESEVDRNESVTPQTGRMLDRVIIGVMTIALGYFIADKFFLGANTQESIDPPRSSEIRSGSSVAVLPFINMSPDPAQEYFSDGITEEIINAVVKIPGVSVPARTSVFEFRNYRGDVREIGTRLGVAHVLEGSVRSQGNQVRITAQLIKVNDGFHLWSETFDRDLENIFVVQEEIAAAIAEALVGELGTDIETVPNRTRNVGAYDTYLRGRAALRNREAEAVALLEQATAADPAFAPAWAALAIAYQSVLEDYQKGIDTARKALTLDADNVDALNAMGAALRQHRHWLEAEEYFDRALAEDPNSVELLEDYAEFLGLVGRTEEALVITRRGMEIDSRLLPMELAHIDALATNGFHAEARQQALAIVEKRPPRESAFLATYLLPVILSPALQPKPDTAFIPTISVDGAPPWVASLHRAVAGVLEGSSNPESVEALKDFYPTVKVAGETTTFYDGLPARAALVYAKELDYVIEHDIWWAGQLDRFPHEYNWTPFFAELRAHPRFPEYLEATGIIAFWDATEWPRWCEREADKSVSCK